MGERTESWLTFVKYTVLIIISCLTVLQNLENIWPVILLSGLLAVSMTMRNAVLSSTGNYRYLSRVTIFIDLFLVFVVTFFDQGSSSRTFYYLVMGDACLLLYPVTGAVAGGVGFILYNIGKYIQSTERSTAGFILSSGQELGKYVMIYIIFCIIVYEVRQKQKLNQTLLELNIKTKQFEDAYEKLKEASEALEEVTVLRERNRIAREIHDTVGHTLTTVLLEMEAGARYIRQDPMLAEEKINLAKGQVRKGLSDIRESVKLLAAGRELKDFTASVKLLIEETMKHSGVFVKYSLSELPVLTKEQENALYRALQEGMTNGIRHGRSTAFLFILKYENGNIRFTLEDNGSGNENITRGFGLTAMEERIKAVGGTLGIQSENGGGCCIDICVPLGKEECNGKD
ncbi:MAG: sensor histidine kinase [Bacillota bacterium]|nr:sensor histidine kinase [Bacillota bacterium]